MTIELTAGGQLPVVCPAGEPVAAVRQASSHAGSEIPGVLCRVVHEPIDLRSDPRSPAVLCCNAGVGGYRTCPVWNHDKGLIAAGFRSMGDERVAREEDDAAMREDLTGSRYGDLSWMEALDEATQDALKGMALAEDGMIRAELGD